MLKLVIFDWDDVITRGSTDAYIKCYHEAISSLGVNLDPEEEKRRIVAKWGSPAREELRELLEERLDLLDEAEDRYERTLMGNTFIDCLSLVSDGIPQMLERLKEKYTLSIATGVNPRLLKEKIMPKFGIPPVFSQIESVYDVPDPEKGKPHPYMVEQILLNQGVKPEESILIGDARGDVLMARAAGVIPVVVLTGHLKEQEARTLGVNYVVPDVTHVEALLSTLSLPEGQGRINGERGRF
ncbi:MAG: HAD family hydrolase [Candidatus Levybacteria bacterium]|nr:HAD family hydrolase [Candidatus Levybacteria bacterium]